MGARRPEREQGIYRRLTVRMWGDAKVLALSRPQPCGQVLWIHLLAGEQTDIIPGLCKIGEAAFAEQLGWSLEGFREAFREVFALGMVRADWAARVVWVPKAIQHNAPVSPNVVKSWADAWDRIPECALKLEAWQTLKAFTEGMAEGFREAFAKACPKPSLKPSGIQDQDQDQDQEEEACAEHVAGAPAPAPPPDSPPLLLAPATPLGRWLVETYPDVRDPDAFARTQAAANPGVDLLAEARRALAWEVAHPERKKRKHGAFLSRWFARAQDTGKRAGAAPEDWRSPFVSPTGR